jgi:antitoxin HicB
LQRPEARVDIDALDAIKLAVIMTFRQAGISKSELARRLGKAESEARRILDPHHPTKLGAMQDALRVMGRTIVISVKEAA